MNVTFQIKEKHSDCLKILYVKVAFVSLSSYNVSLKIELPTKGLKIGFIIIITIKNTTTNSVNSPCTN